MVSIFNPRWFFPLMVGVGALANAAPAPDVNVPVATATLSAGRVVQAADVVMQAVSATGVYAGTAKTMDDVVGLRVTHVQLQGKPFNTLMLKPVPTVARGAAVDMIYAVPGMELRAGGTALEDGDVGQNIKVLNPATRATVQAVVVSSNTVKLAPQ